MLFTEPLFFLFFAVVFGLYWSLPSNGARKVLLLLASYAFYAAWDWRFVFLILFSTVVDYAVGLVLGAPATVPHRRRWWLIGSLAANLGVLGFFKYFNFFVTSATGLLHTLGLDVPERTLEIVLPVGISFYTFQSMSYTIDIYRRKLAPTARLVDFALFVGFFPQLVSGPIVRARTFLPQLRTARRLGTVDVRGALVLFLVGFFKKACISNNLSPVVDPVFASPEAYTTGSVWLAVLSFGVQLYCDFSGYTDMAIACARLLGYELAKNFDFPYFAPNVTELWRRWHMSLSTWLRDYVYFPLGGSRSSTLFTYRNLTITMLLAGLWHGAAWTFVLCGAVNGLGLVVHKEWARRVDAASWIGRAVHRTGPALTFYWHCLALVFFRAEDFESSMTLAGAYTLFTAEGDTSLDPLLWLAFPPMVFVHWLARCGFVGPRLRGLPSILFYAGYGAAIALILPFVPLDRKPFIYFQF